jgi:hypothetical protein
VQSNEPLYNLPKTQDYHKKYEWKKEARSQVNLKGRLLFSAGSKSSADDGFNECQKHEYE